MYNHRILTDITLFLKSRDSLGFSPHFFTNQFLSVLHAIWSSWFSMWHIRIKSSIFNPCRF